MLKEGLRKRLDIWSPARRYPREMVTASLLYFLYLFTWIGWSAWMPQFLANEKHLGFQTAASYLSIWMFCAIFAYYLCGWLSDLFGRRYVIPAFCIPAAILLVIMGQLDSATSLFWVGLILNFLITGSYGSGLGYNTELFPTQIRGTAVGAAFTFGSAGGALAPAIVGWIATSHSIATALPLLAVSFFLIAPMFLFVARETTRKELADRSGSGGRCRCCIRQIKISGRHSRIKAGVLVRHRHRQCDRDFRLNETEFASGDGNSGLTARIYAVKACGLGSRTDRDPQIDVAQIALRPLEFEDLAVGAALSRRFSELGAGRKTACAAIVDRRVPILEPDKQHAIETFSERGVAQPDRLPPLAPAPPHPVGKTQ
jgi:hypothetical protein